MAFVSLYRKYRSQTFSDLIGQDHVVRTLQNGIRSGRIAHSYLFTGPRGTGKTSAARLLAKALCCEAGPLPEPDNTCEICKAITSGSCIDVVEMDAASESGVDDIREQIVEAVEYRPMLCRYKIFIIDEVHDLSAKAFDALLKTIEEPPPHIVFVLATTEFNKVPPTIRSRCQKYDFHRADMEDLTKRLEHVLGGEGVEAEPAAIYAIARMADGGYRDALNLLEQAILTCDGKITVEQVYDQLGLVAEDAVDELLMAIRDGRVPDLIDRLQEIARLGRDPRAILESMMFRLADLTRAVYQMGEPAGDAAREASLHEVAVRIGKDDILRLRTETGQAHRVIRDVSLPRIWLESELVRMSLPQPVKQSRSDPPPPPAAAPARMAPNPPMPAGQESNKPTLSAAPSEPAATGDVDFDAALVAWHEAKIVLGEKSKLMALNLEHAVLMAREGKTLAIQLERERDREWIMDMPKRAPAILDAVRERLGVDVEIKYVVKRKEEEAQGSSSPDPKPVELTLEGQRLEQAAKDILQADRTEPPPEAKQ